MGLLLLGCVSAKTSPDGWDLPELPAQRHPGWACGGISSPSPGDGRPHAGLRLQDPQELCSPRPTQITAETWRSGQGQRALQGPAGRGPLLTVLENAHAEGLRGPHPSSPKYEGASTTPLSVGGSFLLKKIFFLTRGCVYWFRERRREKETEKHRSVAFHTRPATRNRTHHLWVSGTTLPLTEPPGQD